MFSPDQIKKMSTNRLLNIFRQNRFMGYDSDWYFSEEDRIHCEQMQIKHELYVDLLKTELDTREHIPSKREKLLNRKKKIKTNRRKRKSILTIKKDLSLI